MLLSHHFSSGSFYVDHLYNLFSFSCLKPYRINVTTKLWQNVCCLQDGLSAVASKARDDAEPELCLWCPHCCHFCNARDKACFSFSVKEETEVAFDWNSIEHKTALIANQDVVWGFCNCFALRAWKWIRKKKKKRLFTDKQIQLHQ